MRDFSIMCQSPSDIRDHIARLETSIVYVQKQSWKAEKEYEIAHAKHIYISRLLWKISEDNPKFDMMSFRCNKAATKTAHFKTKLEEAKEEMKFLTKFQLKLMTTVWSDRANFFDGIPYSPEKSDPYLPENDIPYLD